MRNVLGAALTFFFAISGVALAQSVDDTDCDCTEELGHFHYPIVFDRTVPPADAYEVIESIRPDTIYDEDAGGMVAACVIYTKAVEYPEGGVPVDEYGVQMIEIGDGMTFLPADVIIDIIYDTSCTTDGLTADAIS